jgi:hypothetical protein
VRHHAVSTVHGGARRHHDHLALHAAQTALAIHDRITVSKERSKLVGAMREGHVHVGNKSETLTSGENLLPHVVVEIFEIGNWKSAKG